jgi:hypothetical protein
MVSEGTIGSWLNKNRVQGGQAPFQLGEGISAFKRKDARINVGSVF